MPNNLFNKKKKKKEEEEEERSILFTNQIQNRNLCIINYNMLNREGWQEEQNQRNENEG